MSLGGNRRDVLHGRIHDFLREVVCTDVASDSENVAPRGLDLVCYRCEAFFIDAEGYSEPVKAHQTDTYSLITTFAPSFANKRAVLRPIPCMQCESNAVKGHFELYLASSCRGQISFGFYRLLGWTHL
jgi:hypothetical protein